MAKLVFLFLSARTLDFSFIKLVVKLPAVGENEHKNLMLHCLYKGEDTRDGFA